jgi:hypothetical protein
MYQIHLKYLVWLLGNNGSPEPIDWIVQIKFSILQSQTMYSGSNISKTPNYLRADFF